MHRLPACRTIPAVPDVVDQARDLRDIKKAAAGGAEQEQGNSVEPPGTQRSVARPFGTARKGDDVAQYTLAEAAKTVGKSKSTVLRSIRAGRVSAARDELTGGWTIDAAELHRIYPAMNDAVHAAPNGASRNGDDALGENEKAALLARIADKDDQIADLRRRRSIRRPRSAAG